jgi:hypothetical protein
MEVAVGGSTIAFSEDEDSKPGQGQGGGRSRRRVPQPDNLFDWAEAQIYQQTFENFLTKYMNTSPPPKGGIIQLISLEEGKDSMLNLTSPREGAISPDLLIK